MSENPIIQYFRMTLLPCLSRLFSPRRRISSLCLFLTLLVCTLLLSSLCLTFGQNLASLENLTASFDDYITLHGTTSQNLPFRESVRTVLAYAQAEIYTTHICFVFLWLVIALAAVSRVFSESVATEKYVYALYIIYGADIRLLRKSIIREFRILGIPALLISLPLGLKLCLHETTVNGFSLLWAVEILLLFFILSLLCARRVTDRLFRENCVQLMSAMDTSEYIESPKRFSLKHILKKHSGFDYALTAFGRMKKHRLTHALSIALIGAILFSMTALTLPDNYATDRSTHEYTLSFQNGVSPKTLEEEYLPAIESLEAVMATLCQATDTAERLGTHLMLLPNQIADHQSPLLLQQEDKWALDTVKIACGDGTTDAELGENSAVIPEKFKNRPLSKLGYTLDTLRAGEAAYVYPEQNGDPKIQVGETVEIAIPDGTEGYDRYGRHITVTVTKIVPVGWIYTQQTFNSPTVERVCPRIYEDYLFLSPTDYGTVTDTVHTQPVSVTETLAEELELSENTCYVILPENMKAQYRDLSHVTVITPDKIIKKAFTSSILTDGKAPELPMDSYFINNTYEYSGIYFGGSKDYEASDEAVNAMEEHMNTVLDKDMGDFPLVTQFRIVGKSFSGNLSSPCVVFKHGETVHFTSMATELSAMTLTSAECRDTALFFMDTEAAVLTADDDTPYEAGMQLLLTTDIPDDFVSALEKAGIPPMYPREEYQLTKTYVLTAFRHNTQSFLILAIDPTGYLKASQYPASINGIGSYLPIGDLRSDTVLTLSDIDSMLVFDGDPKGERENASILQGNTVTNGFTLMTEKEAGLSEILTTDGAILRLPPQHPFALSGNDSVYMAIAQPLKLAMTQMDLKGLDLLAHQLSELNYCYLPFTLNAVEEDSALTSPVLIVSEESFATLCGRAGAITELKIHVDSYADLDKLSQISTVLHSLTAEDIRLDTRNTILKSRGTGSQRYPLILRATILPLCALIPLLTAASARTLHLRREKERSAYVGAGEQKRMRFIMTLGEVLLSALASGIFYAMLCPTLTFLLKLFCGQFHVPLTPDSFSPSAFLLILGIMFISVMGTSMLSLLQLKVRIPFRRKGAQREHIFM